MTTFYIGDGYPAPTTDAKLGASSLFDTLVDAAGGKPLPGKAGLLQALVCCWCQPRHNTPPALHYARLALNTAGIVRRYRDVNDPTFTQEWKDPVREYLNAKGLTIPDGILSLANLILAYSAGVPHEDEAIGETKDAWIRTFRLPGGLSYTYVMRKWNGEDVGTGPYVVGPQHVRFLDEIHELIWTAENHDDLQLSCRDRSGYSSHFSLSNIGHADDYVDDDEDTWRSVALLARRFRAFQAKGIQRNLLFYGPPGTGKTTMGRRVARALGEGHTLRIEATAIERAGPTAVLAFVRLLRPRVLMFDDLDRCMGAVVDLLHTLELSNLQASMTIIGTVNVIGDVDPALLRPGRFGESYLMGEPSEPHRAKILAHYAERFGVVVDVEALTGATEGFSQADCREVVQSAATVGIEYLDAEVDRVRRQRGLYAGGACERYNDRRRGLALLQNKAAS